MTRTFSPRPSCPFGHRRAHRGLCALGFLIAASVARPALAEQTGASPAATPKTAQASSPVAIVSTPDEVPPQAYEYGSLPTSQQLIEDAKKHPPIVWRDDKWTRFQTWEIVDTAALVVGSGIVSELTTSPTNPRWTGPILFDNGARNLLRLNNDVARSDAGIASDVLYYTNSFYPILVDTLGVTMGIRHSSDAAVQEGAIDGEAFAISGFISAATQRFVARQRPFVQVCNVAPNNKDCDNTPAVQNVSFISGHNAMAFTGAFLTCFHHANLHLYGNDVADDATCATFLTTATATSFLRIMSDRHWASDVISGVIVGVGVGYLVPAAHYHDLFRHKSFGMTATLVPNVSTTQQGLSLMGTF